MADDEDDEQGYGNLPLPPLPPGISLPPPPPPGIVLEDDLTVDEVTDDETPQIELVEDADASSPSDFQSQWEKRRASDPSLAVESKDSMYGHIDRIATGEVGTLLDRFSDRFGSELDREIIVLRKKQQQDVRSMKATVELVSAPIETEETVRWIKADPHLMSFPGSLMLSTICWAICLKISLMPSSSLIRLHYSSPWVRILLQPMKMCAEISFS